MQVHEARDLSTLKAKEHPIWSVIHKTIKEEALKGYGQMKYEVQGYNENDEKLFYVFAHILCFEGYKASVTADHVNLELNVSWI